MATSRDERASDAGVLVVGNGMVGHRFVEAAVERGPRPATHRIVVVGEERRRAYDRVHLSSLFDGATRRRPRARRRRPLRPPGVELVLGDPVVDARHRRPHGDDRRRARDLAFDACVLATGSSPFVPPIPGTDAAGVVRLPHARRPRRHPRLGGRLPHAASSSAAACSASRRPTPCGCSGSTTTVVEFAPRLMAVQLDDGGGRALRRHVEALGLARAHRRPRPPRCGPPPTAGSPGWRSPRATTSTPTSSCSPPASGPATSSPATPGLAVGERGGVVVDDACATSRPASTPSARSPATAAGSTGSSPPATRWPRSSPTASPAATPRSPAPTCRRGSSCSASTSPASATRTPTATRSSSPTRPPARGRRSSLDADGRVARRRARRRHARRSPTLVQRVRGTVTTPDVLGAAAPGRRRAVGGPADLPDDAGVCSCHNVSCGTVRAAVDEGFEDVAGVKSCTKAGTGCGSCVPVLQELIDGRAGRRRPRRS